MRTQDDLVLNPHFLQDRFPGTPPGLELSTLLALTQLCDILAVYVTDKKELITSQRSYEVAKFRAGSC